MDADNPLIRAVYIGMAAVAGSITALSMMRWQEMGRGQIALTLFVGTTFAFFVVPWATVSILKIQDQTLQTACALTYLGGTCANAFLPKIIKKISAWLKLDEEKPS
jgi:hypothetical protein